MPEVVSDIILTPVKVLYSPVGTAVPADSVAAGGAWPAGWVSAGFTKEPLKLTYGFEVAKATVEQHLGALDARKTSESVTLETVLAELSGNEFELAWDADSTPTAAGIGTVGKEETVIGDNPLLTKRQWGFEGTYIDEDGAEFPIRVFVWKATAAQGSDLSFGKSDYMGIPIKLEALMDLTKSAGARFLKIQRILEPAEIG